MFIDKLTEESENLRLKFNFLRGATVHSFAAAEFMMKSYLLALTDDERFDDGGGYSHKIEKLIRNFRLSFKKNNFFQTTCDDVNLLIEKFEVVIDDRNQFVHGLARLIVDKQQVEMKRYLPNKNGVDIIIKTYNLETMEDSVKIFDEICQAIILLVMKLDDTLGLGLKEPVS